MFGLNRSISDGMRIILVELVVLVLVVLVLIDILVDVGKAEAPRSHARGAGRTWMSESNRKVLQGIARHSAGSRCL